MSNGTNTLKFMDKDSFEVEHTLTINKLDKINELEYVDGTKESFYIPLQMMRGEKPSTTPRTVLKDWAWAYPTYTFSINKSKNDIKSIIIDPKGLMADINSDNNKL